MPYDPDLDPILAAIHARLDRLEAAQTVPVPPAPEVPNVPIWQQVSQINPILHMVNAFRYGILGVSDLNIGLAIAFMLLTLVILYLWCIHLLSSGRGMRS